MPKFVVTTDDEMHFLVEDETLGTESAKETRCGEVIQPENIKRAGSQAVYVEDMTALNHDEIYCDSCYALAVE